MAETTTDPREAVWDAWTDSDDWASEPWPNFAIGWDAGHRHERARIVAWLREEVGDADTTGDDIADELEAQRG